MRKKIRKIKEIMKKKIKAIEKKYQILYDENFSLEAKISKKEISYDFNNFDIEKRKKDSSILHLIFAGEIDLSESLSKLKYIQPILNEAEYTFCTVNKDIKSVDIQKYPFDFFVKEKIYTKNGDNNLQTINFQGKKIGFLSTEVNENKEQIEEKINKAKKLVDFLICFYNYDLFNNDTVKALYGLEIDYIIGISNGKNYKPLYLTNNKSILVKTLGVLSCKKFESIYHRDSILLNIRIQVKNDTIKIIEDSYIPVFNGSIVNKEKNVPLPINMEEYNEKTIEALDYSRRRLAKSIINLKEEQRFLNVDKIFKILGLEIPDNCRDISLEAVKRLSVTIDNTIENSILFIRPYDGNVYEFSEEKHIEKYRNLINRAEERGVLLIFTPYHFSETIPEIITDNPLIYHDKIIEYIVSKLNLKIKIGVTGSVGKTTTKDLIYEALKYKYYTDRSENNNNTIGIGLHFQKLRPNVEAFVQELGGGKIGRAEGNAKMLGLTSGVVTNIENAHLRMAGSREQLLINKMGIQKGIRDNGPLFINIDNDMLVNYKDKSGVVTFSLTNSKADYYAEEIKFTTTQSIFYVCRKNIKTKVVINLLGEHNVLDAIVAFGVAEYEGVPMNLIIKGLLDYKPDGIRQNIVKIANKTLYVDCFNSNYASLVASTKHLEHIAKNHRKILVFSDYTGLDEENEQAHIDSGEFLSQSDFDLIILYGYDVKITRDILESNGKKVFYSTDSTEICKYLEKEMNNNDYILFKGSSRYELEKSIIDELFGTSMSYERSLSKGIKYRFTDDLNQKFIVTNNFAHINNKSEMKLNEGMLIIPDEVKNLPLRMIYEKAFYQNLEIKKIIGGTNLKSIEKNAFNGCENLEHVNLPCGFKLLNEKVFKNCINLKYINLGKNIIHIGEEAFSNCTSLKEIYLPKSIKYINKEAFYNCQDLVIICEKNTYVHNWVKKNNFNYKLSNIINDSISLNLFDYIFDKDMTQNIISHNAFIGFVLQTGEMFGYNEGKVKIEARLNDGTSQRVYIYVEENNSKKIPILINRYNGVDKSYVAKNLVEIDKKYILSTKINPIYINDKAYNSFIEMHNDAKKENINIVIIQGYRDIEEQRRILNKFIKSHGSEYANMRVAQPGFSQHNLGLAIDIHTENIDDLSKMYRWIEEEAYKYGYCLKNLEGKEHITGSMYEPWHLYYIEDTKIAKELRDNKITLEEYLINNFIM